MRIRSIKPEFYRSEDIAALDWDARLLFIGLWSYVDDNGVGRDVEQLIAADLFALDRDPLDSLARVSRGLASLSDQGLIVRYTVEKKRFLAVTGWERHQRIDKPNAPRYPAPDQGFPSESGDAREGVAKDSRLEQGNRGTGEIHPCSPLRGRAPWRRRPTSGSPSRSSTRRTRGTWGGRRPRRHSRRRSRGGA